MGYGYLLMGTTMSVLTVTLSLKVAVLQRRSGLNLREHVLKRLFLRSTSVPGSRT